MSSPRCFSTTAQALHRVFIGPIDSTPSSLPCKRLNRIRCPPPRSNIVFSSFVRRYSKPAAPSKTRAVRDEEITSRFVQLVGADGKLESPVSRISVLSDLDRTQSFLVQVAPATDDGQPPICKILPKKEVRERERAKAKPSKTPHQVIKTLEMSWAIDGNDLGHRLKRAQDFLAKGMRVVFVVAHRRGGKRVTPDVAEALIQTIRQRIVEEGGAKESKLMEGKLLHEATLFFESTSRKKEA